MADYQIFKITCNRVTLWYSAFSETPKN